MQRRTRKHTILEYLCQNGRTALYTLREPHIGGSSADTQIRKLRNDHGIPIDWEYRKDASGRNTGTTEYFVTIDPEQIDIENLCVKDLKPVQGALDFNVKPAVDLCSYCGGVKGTNILIGIRAKGQRHYW
jgi:hypothetical protein